MMTICNIYDLKTGDTIVYEKPMDANLNGMYGYLSVSMTTVYFFWIHNDHVCCDDVSDRFRVEYIITA